MPQAARKSLPSGGKSACGAPEADQSRCVPRAAMKRGGWSFMRRRRGLGARQGALVGGEPD